MEHQILNFVPHHLKIADHPKNKIEIPHTKGMQMDY